MNCKFSLENVFQEILYRIDNRIGWIIELVESQYISMSAYRALSGSSYVKLPVRLRSPKKGLINIKNNHHKYFLWCRVRVINPVKINPERITGKDKKLANDLDYDRIEFPVREKEFSKIEIKNSICIDVYCYEKKLTFPIYISDQKFTNSMDLLLVTDKNKSQYGYIKDFERFVSQKKKKKTKKKNNIFARPTSSVLVVKLY